jgi:hypothetical protein
MSSVKKCAWGNQIEETDVRKFIFIAVALAGSPLVATHVFAFDTEQTQSDLDRLRDVQEQYNFDARNGADQQTLQNDQDDVEDSQQQLRNDTDE